MLSRLLLVLASAVVMVSSQYSATINPDSVSLSLRQTWCFNQKHSCPLICLQLNGSTGASVNDCDPNTLAYSCICNNGITPNASEYSETMAYYICTEAGNQCVSNCAQGDSSCQSDCRVDHPCGAQHPIRVNVTTTSSAVAAASATASNTNTANPLGTNAATGGAVRMSSDLGHVYGLCLLVGAFIAGFAVLL
ncbi:uncharacterized protein N7498_000308 [Penicillium cinerascens]|uniref:DUF7707 domain-containing protein n=1 Tax=Penicillium cinerascens TaxID=70096 RepID=A0A9W9TDA2_9EURO|nr:uncharacterized protein N7498_000308 [Penicillium cinerascens]KAJ5218209.1 hypothetical protein N7498_000308 [Penicillium cinerascens]